MAKNDYMRRLQRGVDRQLHFQRLFTTQWCADAAIIAANEVFGRRGKKLVEFNNAFVRLSREIAEMTLDDAKGDKTLEYTKYKVDERLKELLGEDFVPWEERYNFGC